MSIVTINDNYLKDIADTIRSNNETDTKYKPSEMAGAIRQLEEVTHYIDPSLVYENEASGYLLVRIIRQIPVIDTSGVTNMSYAYSRFSALEELPEQDWSSASNINNAFATCTSLEKMGGLKGLGLNFPKSSAANTANCTLNLTNAPLDYESAMNIINKVADIKSLGIAAQTIRFNSATFALLSDADKAIATAKGWNITT